MTRRLPHLICTLFMMLAVGCSDPETGVDDDATDASSDMPSSDLGQGDVGTGEDVGANDASMTPVCEDPPDCADDQRVVDCSTCVSKYDRRCVTDADCRETETCEEVDGTKVCWYEPPPVRVCPGSEGCNAGGDGVLYASAVSKVVTPDGFETPTPEGVDEDNYLDFNPSLVTEEDWNDCGYDGLCPGDPGYDSPDDGEGDGIAQGAWIAGFTFGRPAQYCPEQKIGCDAPDCCVSKLAHDDLKVQIAVFRQDDTTVGFATLDVVGFFHTDIEKIRERIPDELGIDLFIMASTHNHEAPDSAGQWGPGVSAPERSGRDPRFIEKIRTQTIAGLEEAVAALEPAEVSATVLDVGVEGLAVSDSRTPYVFDDNVPIVHVTSASSGASIATLLSFANHAEVLWSSNPYITADYPHFVRTYIREGLDAVTDGDGIEVKPALSGTGSPTLMFAGAVGGLINPGRGGAIDYAGNQHDDHSFDTADALGQQLASRVLGAMANGQLDSLSDTSLRFGTKRFLTAVKNTVFQYAAYVFGLMDRDVYNTVKDGLSFDPVLPQLLTQTAVVRLGPITFFTAPGEVFAETLGGGFPGKPTAQNPVVGDVQEHHTTANCDADGLPNGGSGTEPCIVKPEQENPPDWSAAPEGPYVYEWLPGDYPFFIGLGMDFLGYFVPAYDYEEDGYFSAAPGDHYEETNGVGPAIVADWKAALQESIDAVSE